ncbi:MAG: NUDIX hydrolase [Chloroflexi bacterium]|nr:NUDIX hydrolase [Chloroflexota bacterium]
MTDPDRLQDHGAATSLDGFVDGVPSWIRSTLGFCSRCGAPLTLGEVPGEHRERLWCTTCGFIAYVNPRMVVTTLPVTDAGELVLLRRGIEPAYGTWAQPGGFLESDETAIQGAIRETQEEIGLIVEPTAISGIYSQPSAAVVVVVYEARIVGGQVRTTTEAIEVSSFRPEAVPWSGIGLDTTLWALRDWVRRRGLTPGR